MITVFTSCKPFHGHFAVIQENALRSWLAIGCEVLVFGDSAGAADVTRRLGIRHFPDVEINEFGTPLVSALFRDAEQHARHDFLCYANADILFLPDILDAARRLAGRRAMTIGRRWDLDVTEPLDFAPTDWPERLRADALARGHLHDEGGIDYFLFPRGVLGTLPPLVLGRARWDMYMIYRARVRGASVIDATEVVLAVHQNHDYSHLGKGRAWAFEGPETERNLELAGGRDHLFDPRDATHVLTRDGLRRARVPLRRRVRKLAILHPRLGWPILSARRVVRFLRSVWT